MEFNNISVCTGGFRDITLSETLDILEELSFKYVEATTDGRSHIYPYFMGDKPFDELEDLLSRYSIDLIAISGGWSDFAVNDLYIDKQFQSLEKQLKLCNRLDVGILRVFASHIPSKYVNENYFTRVIENIKKIIPIAEENDVCMVLENHYGLTSTAEDVVKILEGVSSPNLRFNFDPANFLPTAQDPVDACTKLLPYIAHIHLKDAVFTGKGKFEGYEYCEIGKGIVNYKKILSIIFKNNYNGFLSVEYENPKDVVRGVVVSRRNLMKLISNF